jgi:hypothetical protein
MAEAAESKEIEEEKIEIFGSSSNYKPGQKFATPSPGFLTVMFITLLLMLSTFDSCFFLHSSIHVKLYLNLTHILKL